MYIISTAGHRHSVLRRVGGRVRRDIRFLKDLFVSIVAERINGIPCVTGVAVTSNIFAHSGTNQLLSVGELLQDIFLSGLTYIAPFICRE